MIPAASHKPAIPFDRMAFEDELKLSVLLDENCQADDTPESRKSDGNKTHLEHLNKRLKSNRCDAMYTVCIIGQYLAELKQIYRGNKKCLLCAAKDLFTISYFYVFIDLCDLATTYYRMSSISLPLKTVQRKFKLMKKIVREDEDFGMNGSQ